jgi:hypothetical protein
LKNEETFGHAIAEGCVNKPASQHEILPPPIDIAGLAKRNGFSELQIMRSIRSAEKRGEAFSRIDSTLRLRWYWRSADCIEECPSSRAMENI